MKKNAFITTSWDDGHPLDLRVANLLARYGLRGTFYVPMRARTGTMTRQQLRELASHFEIGAHTMHHMDLNRVNLDRARQEIMESKAWLEDVIGVNCRMFCPPKGKYQPRHLPLIVEAGYIGARTVELLSIDLPRITEGVAVMPTTIHAFPHPMFTYLKHLGKRRALRNLWLYIRHGRSNDWRELSRSILQLTLRRGGVFHLWGHSWELQQQSQWQRLEEVFAFMREMGQQAHCLSNGEVCERVLNYEKDPASALQDGVTVRLNADPV